MGFVVMATIACIINAHSTKIEIGRVQINPLQSPFSTLLKKNSDNSFVEVKYQKHHDRINYG